MNTYLLMMNSFPVVEGDTRVTVEDKDWGITTTESITTLGFSFFKAEITDPVSGYVTWILSTWLLITTF